MTAPRREANRENERDDEMTDRGDIPFQLEEATIAGLHAAIRAGKTTVVQVVQRYIDRARAYNGVASLLLTEDGAAVPEAVGTETWCPGFGPPQRPFEFTARR